VQQFYHATVQKLVM